MSHIGHFLGCVEESIRDFNFHTEIEGLASYLVDLRGRLFILGIGGSAANASHAVNDFRKLCKIEAYCPSDNVSELTARANDDGLETIYSEWLKGSRINDEDIVLILSVGGGDSKRNVSVSLINAVKVAKKSAALVLGIVGPNGGYTRRNADWTVRIPVSDDALMTPISESFQSIILHALVSHPALQRRKAKWESMK